MAAPRSARAQAAALQPDYWESACNALMRADRVMRRLIPAHGQARLQSRGDAFQTLARSIVGQQISVAAAQSVWLRVQACCGRVDPPGLLGRSPEQLRQAGLSQRKVEYLQDLAGRFAQGLVHPDQWAHMPDEAIIEELVAIRGIGRWTAEMFLIFHLLRPDVLPLDDLGLRRGISQCYFSGEAVSRSELREVASAWQPWRSVGTWYIWRSLDPLPVEY
ncbi:MAG: DNA-3-methyladenine glycosylase 2 family protein [Betaproteobacteria bacterium]|nr:DNA-3-methyladenine glycosylase 2 family protein [Betaproteobacteria bacterium]